MKKSKQIKLFLKEKTYTFVEFLKRKHKEKLTVMLIPHSEKKILNFHISVLSINLVLIFIAAGILISSFTIIGRSGTKHAVQELKLSNKEYKHQRKKIRSEVKPLHELISEFTMLTGKLKANAKGEHFEMKEAIGGPAEEIKFTYDEGDFLEGVDNNVILNNNNPDNESSPDKDKGVKYKFPPEIAILKQGIHNLQLTNEWGSETIELLKKQSKIIRHTPTIWPVKGHLVNSYGKYIDPYTGRKSFNKGLDIGTLPGSEVLATADGIIHRVYEHPKNGYTLEIKHRWGFKTVYGFLERVTVKKEDKVQKGNVVAFAGHSGYTTHCMLHYELWVGTSVLNPYPFLNKLLD
jgi:murein DD-endopeptidase MepM/ murein hydrolase activator NlpD